MGNSAFCGTSPWILRMSTSTAYLAICCLGISSVVMPGWQMWEELVLPMPVTSISSRRVSKPVTRVYRQLYPEQPAESRTGRDGDELALISRQIDRILGKADTLSNENQELEAQNLRLKQDIDVSRNTLERYFLYQLFFGIQEDSAEILKSAEQYGLSEAEYHIVLIIRLGGIDGESSPKETLEGLMQLLLRLLGEKHASTHAILIRQGGEDCIYAMVSGGGEGKSSVEIAELKAQCAFFVNIVQSRFAMRASVGIGLCVQSLRAVKKSAEAARRMLFLGDSAANPSIHVFSDEDMEKNLQYFNLRAQLTQSLEREDTSQYGKVLADYFRRMQSALGSPEDLRVLGRESINIIYDHLTSQKVLHDGLIGELTEKFLHFDEAFPTLQQLIDWEADILRRANACPKNGVPSSGIVATAVRLLEAHYTEDVSLTWMADRLNVSPAYLSRLFRSETGCAFKEYLTGLKMERAQELLLTTTLGIAEIAERVGYNNPKQFSSMFSKRKGQTPLEYRRGHSHD